MPLRDTAHGFTAPMKYAFSAPNARTVFFFAIVFASIVGCPFARQLFAASQTGAANPSLSDHAEKKFARAALPPLANAPTKLPPLVKGKPGLYRVVALPSKFEANAINNKGEIAGTWSAGDKRVDGIPVAVTQAAVWKNRHLTIFPYTTDQPISPVWVARWVSRFLTLFLSNTTPCTGACHFPARTIPPR